MHEYGFLLVIAGVLAAGAMSPGPSFLVVARIAMARSRQHGIAAALGTGTGVALFALLASLGVTVAMQNAPTLFLVLKLIGGAYLLYLAWRIFASAAQPLSIEESTTERAPSYSRSFRQGLLAQTSNPKTALVIAGIYAAFVPLEPPPNTALLLAITAFIIDFSWYALVAWTLSSGRSRRLYERAKAGFDRAAAAFLALVAIRLLLADFGA